MTEHDLSTLVRDHAAADEPPFPTPDAVLARGRRTVRARRGGAGALGAAALAVVAALVVPGVSGDDPTRSPTPTGIDPAVQRALDDYDPQAMPGVIEHAARETLGRSVPDLGRARVHVGDGQDAEVPPEHWDKASTMVVAFGDTSTRKLVVGLAHSRGEAEGDHKRVCAEDAALGARAYNFVCEARTLPGGDVQVTQVTAFTVGEHPTQDLGEGAWGLRRNEVDLVDPERLWFLRHTEVIKSDTFLTYVEETVPATSYEDARSRFAVPVEDQAALAADPRLVMPHPPADPDSGCPAWLVPGSNVTCEEAPDLED